MRLAKYPVIVTIDADLENSPEHIPTLIQQIAEFDIVVASRTKLPRISEKIVSKTLGKLVGVTDTLSNYRAYTREIVSEFNLKGGETFGAEFLVITKKKPMNRQHNKSQPKNNLGTHQITNTLSDLDPFPRRTTPLRFLIGHYQLGLCEI